MKKKLQHGWLKRNQKIQTTEKGSFWSQSCRKEGLGLTFLGHNANKKQLKPAKEVNSRKRKAESLLSIEINLKNSHDEVEEYFAISSTVCRTRNKLVKTTHLTSELVVSLNVNHEEHVLRALAETGASSCNMRTSKQKRTKQKDTSGSR